jgi:hypothetical protein
MGQIAYGGPYTYEVDAIRDERVRAAAEDREPNFDDLFAGVTVSEGALSVIEDVKNPVKPFEGNFIHNVETDEWNKETLNERTAD